MRGLFNRANPKIRRGETLHIEGERNRALETGRNRLLVTGAMFILAFMVIGGRLVEVTLFKSGQKEFAAHAAKIDNIGVERADIVDREGVLLATSLPTVSLYAHPKEIADRPEAARKIASILTDMAASDILTKLRENRAFLYLRRNLTPRQEYDINALGIPGLYFEKGEKRIYPQGELTAHVVGLTDLDNKGIAGIEKSEETRAQGGATIRCACRSMCASRPSCATSWSGRWRISPRSAPPAW